MDVPMFMKVGNSTRAGSFVVARARVTALLAFLVLSGTCAAGQAPAGDSDQQYLLISSWSKS